MLIFMIKDKIVKLLKLFNLVYLVDESVDVFFMVVKVIIFDEVFEFVGMEVIVGVVEFEGLEEVGSLFEVGVDGDDFVNEIFDIDDVVFVKVFFDDVVVGEGNVLVVDFVIFVFVDEFFDVFEVGVIVGNLWFDNFDYFSGGFGDVDEDIVVDLEEMEKLKDFVGFGGNFVDIVWMC